MADALSILMGLQSPTMGNQPQAAPNRMRNNARVGGLRRMLGLGPDDAGISQYDLETAYKQKEEEDLAAETEKAQLATLPEQVRGKFGLQEEALRGATARSVAQTQAETALKNAEATRIFTGGQNDLNREAAYGRTQLQQQGTSGRSAAIIAGQNQRQKAGQNESRAKMLETGKIEPTYPPTSGVLDSLKSFLGLGAYDRTTAAKNEAAKLRQQNSEAASMPGVADVAAEYRQRFPGVSPDQLASIIAREQADATPEEIQAVLDALQGNQ